MCSELLDVARPMGAKLNEKVDEIMADAFFSFFSSFLQCTFIKNIHIRL